MNAKNAISGQTFPNSEVTVIDMAGQSRERESGQEKSCQKQKAKKQLKHGLPVYSKTWPEIHKVATETKSRRWHQE